MRQTAAFRLDGDILSSGSVSVGARQRQPIHLATCFHRLCKACAQDARSSTGLILESKIGLVLASASAAWTVSYREKLRDSFNRLICTQAAQLEPRQCHDEALTWYARGLQADDSVEAMYQGMMRCHIQLGRRADALAAFQRLRRRSAS